MEGNYKITIFFYCYSLTNLRLIQWTRLNDHSETDIRAPVYKTKSWRVVFDTFWSNFKWSTFWHRWLTAAVFWPPTFRACIVRGVLGPYSALEPYVAGKSDLEVSEALKRLKISQNKSDHDNNLCVSSFWCQLCSLIFFFLNILAKVQKWYACQFNKYFLLIVNPL